MCGYVFGYLVASLLALICISNPSSAHPNPSVEMSKERQSVVAYDIYEVEHEISSVQAKNASQTIHFNSVTAPPGCQTCTSFEIRYCLGRDFINDHCCCDKRYHEVLPYIPHTCYIGAQLCKPIAGDCATYQQLRTCCCNMHLLRKWTSNTALTSDPSIVSVIIIVQVFFMHLLRR